MPDMQTWTFAARPIEEWPDGPWQDEPDRIQWEAHGFVCLMLRHQTMGHWCGYVGVDEEHPWHGVDYSAPDVSVHGGLTYSESCAPEAEGRAPMQRVCHVASEGRPDHLYWLGFDCAHLGDISPGSRYDLQDRATPWCSAEYRDAAYVRRECERLARRAKEVTDA